MYDDNFDKFVMSLFKSYDNINIMLGRNDQQYQRVGRMQNLIESVQVDNELKDIMDCNQITYREYYVHNGTTQKIFDDLFDEENRKRNYRVKRKTFRGNFSYNNIDNY